MPRLFVLLCVLTHGCDVVVGEPPGVVREEAVADSGPPWVDEDAGTDAGARGADAGTDAGTATANCKGTYAYLHGDLWPRWYNFRVCCDAEHKAVWRCERQHGKGASQCATVASRYQQCLSAPNGSVCPNWGVCCHKASNGCVDPDAEHRKVCTTSDWDYDSTSIWGTYYGYQWGASTDKHRFTTVKVWNASSQLLSAFSSSPGSSDAYMDGLSNHGVGPSPAGYVQEIKDKYKDRFGAFACIRLETGAPLRLQAFWINDFAHTCSSSYWSQPDAACRSEPLTLLPKPGHHYLWTERGLEELPGCQGPPPEISRWLPQASCSTQ